MATPRRFARVVLPALSVALAGCGGLFYQPTSREYTTPSRLKVRWRDLSILRPGGGRLAAALVEPETGDSTRGLLIQFHGNAQNMTSHWMHFHWAVQRGWSLLVWDYSGYGASEGSASRDQIANDADRFLEWVSDSLLPTRHHGPLVLVGQSLGSAVLLHAFPRWKDRDKATLVVSESGFPSYRSIAFDVASRHWLLWPAYPFVPFLVDNDKSPAPQIPQIAPTPFLIVSCSDDRVVPPSQQRKIRDLAPHSLYWNVDGCKHIRAFQSDSLRQRFLALVDSLDRIRTP